MSDRNAAAASATVRARARSGRLTSRRILLGALLVAVGVFLVLGTYRTLTLPKNAPGGRLAGSDWRDLVIFGVALGAVYALIALGYTLVYGILLMINFAHGEVFTAGAYASFFVAVVLDDNGMLKSDPILAIVILLAVGAVVSMGVAVTLERVAYRPLRNAPRLVPLITAIGASLFLQNTYLGFFGAASKGYPSVPALRGRYHLFGIQAIPILKPELIVIVTAVVAMIALQLFVSRTKTGKSMRAVAEDREIASLMGIDVNRVVVITFAIGGILAGVAAVLFCLVFQSVSPTMGFVPGIKAFTAAVLGGIGSITGAAVGGLILGVLEAVLPFLILPGLHVASPNQLADVIAFSILVLVLLFRPGGILGSGTAEKL